MIRYSKVCFYGSNFQSSCPSGSSALKKRALLTMLSYVREDPFAPDRIPVDGDPVLIFLIMTVSQKMVLDITIITRKQHSDRHVN